jgi:glutamate-1-semialdehyde aminotransferase
LRCKLELSSVVRLLHASGNMAFHASFAASSEPITRYCQLQDGGAGRYGRLADTLIGQGVWVAGRGIWYVSAAHTAADISETVDRIESAFQIFTAAGPASEE